MDFTTYFTRNGALAASARRLVADREDIPADIMAGIIALASEIERDVRYMDIEDYVLEDTGGNLSENTNRPDGSISPSGGATGQESEEANHGVEELIDWEKEINTDEVVDDPNTVASGDEDSVVTPAIDRDADVGTPEPVTGNDPNDVNRPDPSRMGNPTEGFDIGPNGEPEDDDDSGNIDIDDDFDDDLKD